jgi:hypothetical protein
MPAARTNIRSIRILLATCLVSASVGADSSNATLYELLIETGMPHLEENLRYANTTEQRCLSDRELAEAFPILKHESLGACHLEPGAHVDRSQYRLVCAGTSGTTGEATWRFERNRSIGTLNVKLGGKNMTFYQRVTAHALHECSK